MTQPKRALFSEHHRQGLRRTAARAGAVARGALRVLRLARAVTLQLLEFLLAVVILFEEWGWRPLAALLARLGRLRPIARLEAMIVRLPPYPALAVFAMPTLLLLPMKLLALWLVAGGHIVWATLLFIVAKIAGTALVARIFLLTQPALMQLGWFASAYDTIIPWKHALVEHVRNSRVWRMGRILKSCVKKMAHAAWIAWRPHIELRLARLRALLGWA